MQKPSFSSKHVNWFPISVLATVFFILFYSAIRELFLDWKIDPNYQHGFLILIVAAYLIWQKREGLRKTTFTPAYAMGFLVLLFSMLAFIVANAGAEWFLSRVAMLSSIAGLVIYFGGARLFRQLWFPLLYLGFMIPLPYIFYYRLTFPLQQLASFSAFQTLKGFGISGLREGNILHFSGFSLEVIEACSGLRSIMTLTASAALLAYLSSLPNGWRWLLFIAAVPVAVVANVFRLVFIALVGIFWSSEAAEGFLHEGSGLLVFLCGLFLLLGLVGILQWFNSRRHIGWSSA
jgi:exosortase